MIYPNLFARLLANSAESEKYAHRGCPCWEYTGYMSPRGYGRFPMRVPGRKNPVGMMVHRVMAEVVLGRPLATDETIDHGCTISWCINYWHFRGPMTKSENSIDARARQLGYPRKTFPYLIDAKLYVFDPLIRELPRLRSELLQEIPF